MADFGVGNFLGEPGLGGWWAGSEGQGSGEAYLGVGGSRNEGEVVATRPGCGEDICACRTDRGTGYTVPPMMLAGYDSPNCRVGGDGISGYAKLPAVTALQESCRGKSRGNGRR